MKKFIALALTFATIITLAGCKPADNDYVKLAKHNDYWYTKDGISYGMSIEECRKILKKRDVEVMESVIYDNDDAINTALTYKGEMYGQEATVQLEFMQLKDDSPLAKREWLYSIRIIFGERGVPSANILLALEKELSSFGKYDFVDAGYYVNTRTFKDISGIDEKWTETPLDVVVTPTVDGGLEVSDVKSIDFYSVAAAAYAVTGNEGLDTVERLLLDRYELGRIP